MLLIDGVKYELWTPPTEDEFERVVKEHTQEIFGEQSIYLDRKQKLKSLSGIGSIPDGYVIILGTLPQWHIVEVELSSHPLHDHIVSQVSKFINGIKNPTTQREIAGSIYNEIINDSSLTIKAKKAISSDEVYKSILDCISKSPEITIIIEEETPELDEVMGVLAQHPQVVEFRTFISEKDKSHHAHFFKPLYNSTTPSELEIGITSSNINNRYLRIPRSRRNMFPGYKMPFDLETDIGLIRTWVSYGHGAKVGDLDKGKIIRAKLAKWYRKHPTIKVGDKVIIKAIEPMKKYSLEIAK